MKYPIQYFLLFFVLLGDVAISHSQTPAVSITADFGDGASIAIIGTNKQTLAKLKKVASQNSHNRGINNYVIDKQAFKYLLQFVETNCNRYRKTKITGTQYIIQYYPGGNKSSCYYTGSKEALKYFNEMLRWIKKSKYASSFDKLIAQLELYIKVENSAIRY